jgi:hypothetical protein
MKAPVKPRVSRIKSLQEMNQPLYYRPSVVENEQLTHKATGRCRLRIYEPNGWRSMRMRLVINNLRSKGMWKARSWIDHWPSQNHS